MGRFVYVVGGFGSGDGTTTAAVERYDLRRDRWKRMRDMPVALNHAAAVAHRGRVYVHGGYASATGLQEPTTALLRYDPGARPLDAAGLIQASRGPPTPPPW